MKENNNGITLVALVITIIIMLILAAITIGATVNGGLFNYAGKTKTSGDDAKNREEIQSAYLMAVGKSKTHGVSISSMQQALDKVFGQNYAEAFEDGAGIVVKIGERYYIIDKDGKVGEGKTLEPIPYAGDITKDNTCTGTQSNPYRIECIEDLVALAKNVNSGTSYSGKYFVLVNTLDFNSIFSYGNYKAKYSYDSTIPAYVQDEASETTIKELCTTGQGFIPIGLSQNQCFSAKLFDGKYENKEHEIRNIYIKSSNRNAGLFGYITGTTIKNLGITGEITTLTSNRAGGIVAQINGNTIIENCYNKANIKGQSYTGGIVGQCNTISNTIKKCYNTGTITSEASSAGGIEGYGSVLIEDCYNEGNIYSTANSNYCIAAGIATSDSNCNRCYNTGTITGTQASGILFSFSKSADVINCYNTGTIIAKNNYIVVGIGRATASIKNCYNMGEITSNSGIAGIGFSVPIITNCCSIGYLHKTGNSIHKAIVCESGTLTNCFYLDGIEANTSITPEASITSFIKTSDDPNAMTTAKVVAALNNYIELKGVIEEGDTEVDTTGWCKWRIGENNLPELDFDTEWKGTEWKKWNGTEWVAITN